MSRRPARTARESPAFRSAYARILRGYLEGRGEHALREAYEAGRIALAEGRSLLELADAHHAALAGALEGASGKASAAAQVDRAREVLGECLSPYEMAFRGFDEAVRALRRVNETLEREIQRIAHDVHDEAGQVLVAAKLAVSAASREASPSQAQHLAEVARVLDRLDGELRRISRELRPLILDDLGLVPALRLLAATIGGRSQLAVAVESEVAERLPAGVETARYRVVQEALTNAARHARAREVVVHLARLGRWLVCLVRDDGVGFAADPRAAGPGPRGLGLVGMRERLAAVGGNLQVRSEPGRGTEILVRVPGEG
jgi:signal transduction histidine kinase